MLEPVQPLMRLVGDCPDCHQRVVRRVGRHTDQPGALLGTPLIISLGASHSRSQYETKGREKSRLILSLRDDIPRCSSFCSAVSDCQLSCLGIISVSCGLQEPTVLVGKRKKKTALVGIPDIPLVPAAPPPAIIHLKLLVSIP